MINVLSKKANLLKKQTNRYAKISKIATKEVDPELIIKELEDDEENNKKLEDDEEDNKELQPEVEDTKVIEDVDDKTEIKTAYN